MSDQISAMHLLRKISVIIIYTLIASIWMGCGNDKTGAAEKKEDNGKTICPEIAKAWNNLTTNLQRRNDLVKNFANVIKTSGSVSDSLLIVLADSRVKASDPISDSKEFTAEKLASFEEAQRKVGESLSVVLVEVEKKPELKNSKAFADLQMQLEGLENRIRMAKKDYNNAVNECKTLDETHKKNLLLPATGEAKERAVDFH